MRKNISQRLTSALYGGVVTAVGLTALAALSGYELDLGLIAIWALAIVGTWLLLTAALSAVRSREPKTKDAPVDIEEARERAESVADA